MSPMSEGGSANVTYAWGRRS